MKKFTFIWSLAFSALLIGYTVYALMDTFFISRVIAVAADGENTVAADGENAVTAGENTGADEATVTTSGQTGADETTATTDGQTANTASNGDAITSDASATDENTAATTTATTYSDGHITITISEQVENDTVIHIADVVIDDPSYLKTALAQNSFGRNVTDKTSNMAEAADAILAINGDYYGAQEKGYVIRNGVLYRDTPVEGKEDLAIYPDGSFAIINESDVSAKALANSGVLQLFSFGPALIENGSISVSENDRVAREMNSNPRTAIGTYGSGHYVFVVSDGRTEESEGLSLYELASFMERLGCETAYNLDGGGSSTMYFNGQIINTPTGGGHGSRSGERSVSDIVYIGY